MNTDQNNQTYATESATTVAPQPRKWAMILYPYLIYLPVVIAITSTVIENVMDVPLYSDLFRAIQIILFQVYSTVLPIYAFVVAIVNTVHSVRGEYDYPMLARRNSTVKCLHIPAYIINFAFGLMGIFISVWGFLLVFAAVYFATMCIAISGTNAVGTAICLYRNNQISLAKCILFIVLGYVFVADVILALYLRAKFGKSPTSATTCNE